MCSQVCSNTLESLSCEQVTRYCDLLSSKGDLPVLYLRTDYYEHTTENNMCPGEKSKVFVFLVTTRWLCAKLNKNSKVLTVYNCTRSTDHYDIEQFLRGPYQFKTCKWRLNKICTDTDSLFYALHIATKLSFHTQILYSMKTSFVKQIVVQALISEDFTQILDLGKRFLFFRRKGDKKCVIDEQEGCRRDEKIKNKHIVMEETLNEVRDLFEKYQGFIAETINNYRKNTVAPHFYKIDELIKDKIEHFHHKFEQLKIQIVDTCIFDRESREKVQKLCSEMIDGLNKLLSEIQVLKHESGENELFHKMLKHSSPPNGTQQAISVESRGPKLRKCGNISQIDRAELIAEEIRKLEEDRQSTMNEFPLSISDPSARHLLCKKLEWIKKETNQLIRLHTAITEKGVLQRQEYLRFKALEKKSLIMIFFQLMSKEWEMKVPSGILGVKFLSSLGFRTIITVLKFCSQGLSKFWITLGPAEKYFTLTGFLPITVSCISLLLIL